MNNVNTQRDHFDPHHDIFSVGHLVGSLRDILVKYFLQSIDNMKYKL